MTIATLNRIDVTPMSPLIGAVVKPGDLRTASDAVVEQVREAVHKHQVIALPGQHLFGEELLAVARRFGAPVAQPAGMAGDMPVLSTYEITLDRPPRADNWHTDISFFQAPPAFGLLSNVVAPKAGGDTIFSSSHEAYNALSPALQRFCRTLSATHAPAEGLRSYALRHGGEAAVRRIDEMFPPRDQPLVIRHPHTSRLALYLSAGGAYIERINGLKPHESEALMALLIAPYENPNHQARWRWTPGDLVIWDQRAVNHRGLSDHFPAFPHRKMESVWVADGIPAVELAA